MAGPSFDIDLFHGGEAGLFRFSWQGTYNSPFILLGSLITLAEGEFCMSCSIAHAKSYGPETSPTSLFHIEVECPLTVGVQSVPD